jgi:tRNA threonylcarbamoyladenosine biosynthesis protein TsaE
VPQLKESSISSYPPLPRQSFPTNWRRRQVFKATNFYLTHFNSKVKYAKILIMITDSPKQTQKIAELLVKTLIKNENHPNIFCLQGDLGTGKTTFIQGIAKALKIKEKITSPTFVLMKNFSLNKRFPFSKLYHFDCYRFDQPKEILVLGFKEIIENPKNLVFIEWPEKIKKFISKNAIWINFKVIGKNKREIIIS